MNWEVIPNLSENSFLTLDFFPAQGKPSKPICSVIFERNPSYTNITWKGRGKERSLTGNQGLLIVPGYPAPCNILPALQPGQTKDITVSETAGGHFFTTTYRVSVETVSAETARANGWIKSDPLRYENPLKLITAENQKNEWVVRQLWEAGAVWWIYEETPYRRSWVVTGE